MHLDNDLEAWPDFQIVLTSIVEASNNYGHSAWSGQGQKKAA
jgi:hypothetical protein